ncbi:VOC family protein [Thermus caliditerrae]|uniref:VOC family protein n=1 Tax=Thermus caliditerrae TaxID=1330700 RepID=UPI001F3F5831|nr:VOC family protein [Thermus caliditerrae]
MSESVVVYVPDLGQGVSFYQALGLTLEELTPEREALLAPLEGPLLLLRPGNGGVERGPQRPRPEGRGFARLRLEEGRLVFAVESLEHERLRLAKYGLAFRDAGDHLLLFDPGENPVLVQEGL